MATESFTKGFSVNRQNAPALVKALANPKKIVLKQTQRVEHIPKNQIKKFFSIEN